MFVYDRLSCSQFQTNLYQVDLHKIDLKLRFCGWPGTENRYCDSPNWLGTTSHCYVRLEVDILRICVWSHNFRNTRRWSDSRSWVVLKVIHHVRGTIYFYL
jgi:hypothetical protein